MDRRRSRRSRLLFPDSNFRRNQRRFGMWESDNGRVARKRVLDQQSMSGASESSSASGQHEPKRLFHGAGFGYVHEARNPPVQTKTVELQNLFCVDRVGEDDMQVEGNRPLPIMYENKYPIALSDRATVERLEESAQPMRPKQTCFNCQQLGHIISQCPFELSEDRIRQNRNFYRLNKPASQELPKSYRYHGLEGAGHARKFANIRPGEYSEELRSALGLRRHQLPPFIYRMRQIGYPEAWLKEAECSVSVHGGGALSVESQESEGTQYDPEKFVRFPGATDPVPDGFRDEFEKYRVPKYRDDLIRVPASLKSIKLIERKSSEKTPIAELKKSLSCDSNATEPMESDKCDRQDDFAAAAFEPNSTTIELDEKSDKQMLEDSVECRLGTSLSVDDGTPIMLSRERIDYRIPSADKFAQGIGEHRLFENLPGSTGNFTRLMETVKRLKDKK